MPVGEGQQGGPVGGQQHRAAHSQAAHCVDDRRLALAVKVRGRLVQEHERAVGKEGAGQGDPLPLARRQTAAALPEQGSLGVRQSVGEVHGTGLAERTAYVGVDSVGAGEAYVVGDGPGDEVRVLRDPGDMAVPLGRVDVGQVPVADADGA